MMFLRSNNSQEYIGETDIDGLPVDHFQSCVTWDDVNAVFTLDYYFTTSGFKPRDSQTPSQIPVRAEVTGEIESGDQTKTFHHIYEYLDFRVFPELPPETFSLPDFMSCDGDTSNWQKPFPTLPESMSYTVETVTHSSTGDVQIKLATVHLDGFWKFIRVDQGRSSSISDFSTGVEYVLDDSGCLSREIDPDKVAWAQNVAGEIALKDRPEISNLKKTFFFTGFKTFRRLSTYSFAAVSPDAVVEAYISTDGVTPIGLNVSRVADGSYTIYNIFNFDSTSNRSTESPFDIQRCRDSSSMSDLTMTFYSHTSVYYILHAETSPLKLIGNSLRSKAAELAGVSPMQIISKDVSGRDKKIYWMFRVLGGDPASAQAKVKDQLAMKDDFLIESELSTAMYEGKFTLSIPYEEIYSGQLKLSALDMIYAYSSYYLSVASDIKYNFENVYGKCVKKFGDEAQLLTKHNVEECAQACADSRDVACNLFEYIVSLKTCHLSWADESPELIDGNDCAVYRKSYLAHFLSQYGYTMVQDKDVTYRKAEDIEACAKLCMEETSFFCESFDYCSDEKRCQMYKTHVYGDGVEYDEKSQYLGDCRRYSRSYYDEYEIIYDSDMEAPKLLEFRTEFSSKCAYLCSKYEDGCLAYSFRYANKGEEKGYCKLLPSSQADHVTFKPTDDSTSLGVSPLFKGARPGAKVASLSSVKVSSSRDASTGYGTGAMFGLAVAMLATGIAGAGLVVFLLRHFNVWEGF